MHSSSGTHDVWTARIDQVNASEWASLLDRFADANLYQTWAYGAVSWGERQLSHLVLYRSGEPAALAQLRIVKVPIVGSGVAYLRWGPVCMPRSGGWCDEVFQAVIDALKREYVQKRRLVLRIVPQVFQQDSWSDTAATVISSANFQAEPNPAPYRTIRVDLAAPTDSMRKRLDGKWRNQLNAAERNGLAIVEGTSDELFGEFIRLYEEMMARKQFDTTVDPVEFRRIQAMLSEQQKMLIMISQKDGRPMTGLIASVVGETGIYLLGATSNDGMKSKGSYLLQWNMMQRLKERGCRWYDLGGINPAGNPGVYHFKQGMGGEEVLQLPRVSASGGTLSSLTVSMGERLAAMKASFRARSPELTSSTAASAAPAQ